MEAARTAGHPQASETRRAYDLLATIQSHDPDSVEEVLRHPSVGAWARHTIQALRAGSADAAPGQLAGLAAAAANRSRITCEVDVPVLGGVITLPSLGQATVLPGAVTATVQCSPDGAEVTGDGFLVLIPSDPREPAPGWHGLRSLFAETDGVPLRVVIDDVDPYRMPGLSNLGGRLTSSEADRWQITLDQAWDLLVRHHGTMADETPRRSPC